MQAWLCETLDGAEALRWQDLPTPEPKRRRGAHRHQGRQPELPDLLIVEGKYQFKPPLPFRAGREFAGTVDAVGEGVTPPARGHAGGRHGPAPGASAPTPAWTPAACCRCRRVLRSKTARPLPSPTAPRTTR
jgi:NADPH2:quinone reductase